MSINSVNISGHLTGNIDLRATAGGNSVLSFCVVVSDRRRDKNGEWTDNPNYINCAVFGTRADSLSKIFEKGMKVAISGHLRQESWEKDGQKRTSVSVVAEQVDIMSRSNGAQAQVTNNANTYTSQPQNGAQNQSYGPTGVDYYDQQGSVNEYYAQESIPF